MIPAGEFRARVVSGALGTTKSGKDQIGLAFRLLDPPNESITWYGFFTDAAFDITMRGLRAAGFTGDDVSDFSWIERAPEVILVIEHEWYEDKERARVKFINSGGGLAMRDQLDPVAARGFADRMKGRVLLFNQAQPPPREPAQGGFAGIADGPRSQREEDIPF